MLTSLQHQFAPRLTDRCQHRAYATHMCGLCHALGDQYGLLSRLATSHELILLNLLMSAQCPDEPARVERRCPLNPLLKVTTNPGPASQFAAAVAVELANVKFADDVQDSGGWDMAAHLGRRIAHKPHHIALQVLTGLGFDTDFLTNLGERQTRAEADQAQDPAGPSALTSAELFAMTARLAGIPANAEPLAVIGANFGAYIYLLDAYQDFARDMAQGDYNPLRRFCERSPEAITLSQSGLAWLLRRFEMIRTSIRQSVPKLRLYRYQALLSELLYDPLEKIVLELSQRVGRRELTFQRWPWIEALKAGLFILPATATNTGLVNFGFGGEPEMVTDPARKQERRGPCDCSDPCWRWDSTHCYCPSEGCGHVPCGHLPDCGSMQTSLTDCSHGSCGQADCSGVDCSHVDCSGIDCSSFSGVDCSSCSGVDCGGCN